MAGLVVAVEFAVALRIGWPTWQRWRGRRTAAPAARPVRRTALAGWVALDGELLVELTSWDRSVRTVWARGACSPAAIARAERWRRTGTTLDVLVAAPPAVVLRAGDDHLAVELLADP